METWFMNRGKWQYTVTPGTIQMLTELISGVSVQSPYWRTYPPVQSERSLKLPRYWRDSSGLLIPWKSENLARTYLRTNLTRKILRALTGMKRLKTTTDCSSLKKTILTSRAKANMGEGVALHRNRCHSRVILSSLRKRCSFEVVRRDSVEVRDYYPLLVVLT